MKRCFFKYSNNNFASLDRVSICIVVIAFFLKNNVFFKHIQHYSNNSAAREVPHLPPPPRLSTAETACPEHREGVNRQSSVTTPNHAKHDMSNKYGIRKKFPTPPRLSATVTRG